MASVAFGFQFDMLFKAAQRDASASGNLVLLAGGRFSFLVTRGTNPDAGPRECCMTSKSGERY